MLYTNETLIEIDAIVEETEGGCALENATRMEGKDSLVVKISCKRVSVHSEVCMKWVTVSSTVHLTKVIVF